MNHHISKFLQAISRILFFRTELNQARQASPSSCHACGAWGYPKPSGGVDYLMACLNLFLITPNYCTDLQMQSANVTL